MSQSVNVERAGEVKVSVICTHIHGVLSRRLHIKVIEWFGDGGKYDGTHNSVCDVQLTN